MDYSSRSDPGTDLLSLRTVVLTPSNGVVGPPTVRSRERPPSPPPVHATSLSGQHERVAQEPQSAVDPTIQTLSPPVQAGPRPQAAAVQDAAAAQPSSRTVSTASPAPRTYSRESPVSEDHPSGARMNRQSFLHRFCAGRDEEAWRRWARPLGRLGGKVAHSLARHVVWGVHLEHDLWPDRRVGDGASRANRPLTPPATHSPLALLEEASRRRELLLSEPFVLHDGGGGVSVGPSGMFPGLGPELQRLDEKPAPTCGVGESAFQAQGGIQGPGNAVASVGEDKQPSPAMWTRLQAVSPAGRSSPQPQPQPQPCPPLKTSAAATPTSEGLPGSAMDVPAAEVNASEAGAGAMSVRERVRMLSSPTAEWLRVPVAAPSSSARPTLLAAAERSSATDTPLPAVAATATPTQEHEQGFVTPPYTHATGDTRQLLESVRSQLGRSPRQVLSPPLQEPVLAEADEIAAFLAPPSSLSASRTAPVSPAAEALGSTIHPAIVPDGGQSPPVARAATASKALPQPCALSPPSENTDAVKHKRMEHATWSPSPAQSWTTPGSELHLQAQDSVGSDSDFGEVSMRGVLTAGAGGLCAAHVANDAHMSPRSVEVLDELNRVRAGLRRVKPPVLPKAESAESAGQPASVQQKVNPDWVQTNSPQGDAWAMLPRPKLSASPPVDPRVRKPLPLPRPLQQHQLQQQHQQQQPHLQALNATASAPVARSDTPGIINKVNNDAVDTNTEDDMHIIRHVSEHDGGHIRSREGSSDARRLSLPVASPRTGAAGRPARASGGSPHRLGWESPSRSLDRTMQEVREIKSQLRPVAAAWGASSLAFTRGSAPDAAPQLTADEQVSAILTMEEEDVRDLGRRSSQLEGAPRNFSSRRVSAGSSQGTRCTRVTLSDTEDDQHEGAAAKAPQEGSHWWSEMASALGGGEDDDDEAFAEAAKNLQAEAMSEEGSMIVHDTDEDPALRAVSSVYSPIRRMKMPPASANSLVPQAAAAAAAAAGVGYAPVSSVRVGERAHMSWSEEDSPTATLRGLSFSGWQTGQVQVPSDPAPTASATSAGSAVPRSPSLLGMEFQRSEPSSSLLPSPQPTHIAPELSKATPTSRTPSPSEAPSSHLSKSHTVALSVNVARDVPRLAGGANSDSSEDEAWEEATRSVREQMKQKAQAKTARTSSSSDDERALTGTRQLANSKPSALTRPGSKVKRMSSEPMDATHHQSYEEWAEMEETRSLAPIAERTLSGRGSTDLADAGSLLASSLRGDRAVGYPSNHDVASLPSLERKSETTQPGPSTFQAVVGGGEALDCGNDDGCGGGDGECKEEGDDTGAWLTAENGIRIAFEEGEVGVGSKISRRVRYTEEKMQVGNENLGVEVGGDQLSAPLLEMLGTLPGCVSEPCLQPEQEQVPVGQAAAAVPGVRGAGEEAMVVTDMLTCEAAVFEGKWIGRPGTTPSEQAIGPCLQWADRDGLASSDVRAIAEVQSNQSAERDNVSSERSVEKVEWSSPNKHSLRGDNMLVGQQVSGYSLVMDVESVRGQGAENFIQESQLTGAQYPGIRTFDASSGDAYVLCVGDTGVARDTARCMDVHRKQSPSEGGNFNESHALEFQEVVGVQGELAMKDPSPTMLTSNSLVHGAHAMRYEEMEEVTSVVRSSSEMIFAAQSTSQGEIMSAGDVLMGASKSTAYVNTVSLHGEHTSAPMDTNEFFEVTGFESSFHTSSRTTVDASEVRLTCIGNHGSDDLDKLAKDEGSQHVMPRALRAMRRMHHLIQTTRDINENQ